MKRLISLSLLLLVAASLSASAMVSDKKKKEDKESTHGYKFTPVKEIACTPAKDQNRSGTCWSFSGLGFLESEILKNGKEELYLSPMWVARHTYYDKAIKFVRMHGKMNFSAGGATHDVMNVIDRHGIVPNSVYEGLNYGVDNHDHSELDAVLSAYVTTIIKNPNKVLSTAWTAGLNGILDAYFGEIPTSFEYDGKEFTPIEFAKYLGLNGSDYVSLTSFSHQPFYSQYAIEVPDNWAAGLSYNLPLDEFVKVFEDAVMSGYTIFWASDVSEKGFEYAKGYAVIPEEVEAPKDLSGTELSKWVELKKEKDEKAKEGPAAEKVITQEMRQKAFDNYQTTDDHGMQIVGIAADQDGDKYYKVKNSWGTEHLYDGFFYASFPFIAYKTMNMVVNKNAIPKEIRAKLNID